MGNVPCVCWCSRLGPEAEAGRTTRKPRPQETGRPSRHYLPRHFQEGPVRSHAAAQPAPTVFLHPLAESPQRKQGFLGDPPHLPSGGCEGAQAAGPHPLFRPGHRVRLRTGTAGGGAPARLGARDSRSHAPPQLAGAPSPADTPFLRRQPLATLCCAAAPRSRL